MSAIGESCPRPTRGCVVWKVFPLKNYHVIHENSGNEANVLFLHTRTLSPSLCLQFVVHEWGSCPRAHASRSPSLARRKIGTAVTLGLNFMFAHQATFIACIYPFYGHIRAFEFETTAYFLHLVLVRLGYNF